jgi:hypothetical protein
MRTPQPWTPEEDEILGTAVACQGMLYHAGYVPKL